MTAVNESIKNQIKKAKTIDDLNALLASTKSWKYVLPRTRRQWDSLAKIKRVNLGSTPEPEPVKSVAVETAEPVKKKREYKKRKPN